MKGYIYKITNADESIVYVGSTTLTLERRWAKHSVAYKRWIESKVRCGAMIYHHFREHGIENFNIHLVSEHEVEERKNLLQFEQLVIGSTKCVNKNAAWESEEDKLASKRKYNLAYNKTHNTEVCDCECGETYTRGHKARHDQTERHRYGIASDEERQQIDRQREEDDSTRKEALKARRNVKVECECGGSYPKSNKSFHVRKSKVHLQWIADHQ